MSTIREYLEEEAKTPNAWLRRKPKVTHPEILALVREFEEGGGTYNDDAERFVIERSRDLPEWAWGDDRDPLLKQLGAEVYVAKGILTDERNVARAEALAEEGFVPLDEVELVEGGRYMVAFGTRYSGYDFPTYGKVHGPMRAFLNETWGFLPPRAKTRGYKAVSPALVKPAA